MNDAPELRLVGGKALDESVPAGAPCVVMNAASGSCDKLVAREEVEQVLRDAGRAPAFFECAPDQDMAATCRRAALQARETGGTLVAAGGDGTVNLAAAASREHGVTLGIIPLGTFNYFARLHEIPLETGAAASVLLDGRVVQAAVGEVNGRVFLNNASFGLYTRMIQSRELADARFGRYRLVAALSAAAALIRGQEPFAVRFVADDVQSMQRTSMVFVANNALQLAALELDAQACMRGGSLGVLVLRPTRLRDRLRLLLRTALKDLDRDQRLMSFCAAEFEVQSQRRSIELVLDGEIVSERTPLRFRAVPGALRLIVPRGGSA